MPRTARITGRLDSMGAVRKWLSIQWAPDSSSTKLSNPMFKAIVIPMADHRLYLPPTQSQNSNIFASSMPNLVTNDLFVLQEMKVKMILMDKQFPRNLSKKMTLKYPYLRATKCLATKLGFLAERRNQVLQVSALVIVSWWKILKFVSTRISPYLRGEGLRSDDK